MEFIFVVPNLIGASIAACRGTGRHIVALEEDVDIFNAILKPLKRTVSTTVTPSTTMTTPKDPDAMTVVPRKFVRKTKFSK